MVPKEAHFDDASFLVVMKVINVFLNGIIYFLLHQLMHLFTKKNYKKYIIYN